MNLKALKVESSDEFAEAAASLAKPIIRAELEVEQIESPEGIAPLALAFAAELPNRASESRNRGVGRIVFIWDESQAETWGSNMRVIAYGKSPLTEVERGVHDEPSHWYWGMLMGALKRHNAKFSHEAGTVTVMTSQGMGSLHEENAANEVELRASWSPQDGDFAPHFAAWQDLIAGMAGYSPEGDAVVAISKDK